MIFQNTYYGNLRLYYFLQFFYIYPNRYRCSPRILHQPYPHMLWMGSAPRYSKECSWHRNPAYFMHTKRIIEEYCACGYNQLTMSLSKDPAGILDHLPSTRVTYHSHRSHVRCEIGFFQQPFIGVLSPAGHM